MEWKKEIVGFGYSVSEVE